MSKRINKALEGIDRKKLYPLDAAIKMIKERAKAKFDETIEIAMNLGVDPRHADQMVRGVCQLPSGSGRNVRVAVFARGELRAVGDVLLEQLFFMLRTGFDAFEIQGPDPSGAYRTALADFSVWYQPTGDGRPTAMQLRRGR